MTLRNYIEQVYDVREKIAERKRDPIQDFINNDPFPFSYIANDCGQLVKMLTFDNDKREISVLDLISYYPDDISKTKDEPLINLYNNYMRNIECQSLLTTEQLANIRRESLLKNGFNKDKRG